MAFIDWIVDQFGQIEAHPVSTLKCPDLSEPVIDGLHLILLARWQPQLPCCCYSTQHPVHCWSSWLGARLLQTRTPGCCHPCHMLSQRLQASSLKLGGTNSIKPLGFSDSLCELPSNHP